MTKDNHALGKFDLTGIPAAPRGTPQIEVTFEVDNNGILQVTAADKGTGKTEKIVINNDKGRLTPEEIERMVKEAEEFAEEDNKVKERIEAKNGLDSYVYSMRQTVESPEKLADKLDEDDKKIVLYRFIDVSFNYYEIYQSKAVNIVGKVRYNNSNGQLVESFPLTSQYAFEHYYATYQGDKRALDDISLRYIRNKEVSFPTNEQMIYDVGEDLKNRLKRIIVNSNL